MATSSAFADSAQNVTQLPVITITAEDEEESYTVKSTKAATKLDLTPTETPQSVTIFTRQQIEDQNLNSTSAILEQTAGVFSQTYGMSGSGGGTSYFSRGFSINNYQRDGMPTSVASFGGANAIGLEDSAIYERVEITKGSTGLTSGSGNPSASINYVRKRPTEDLTGSVRIQAGSWNNYRSESDVSGRLNADHSIRGRAVAAYEQGGSQQERFHRQNTLIYGALDFDLSDKTTFTTAINAQQIKLDDAPQVGFVTSTDFIYYDANAQPQPQKQTTYNSRKDNNTTDWTYSNIEKLNIILGLEHQFNDSWKAIANYAYSKSNWDSERGYVGSEMAYVNPFTHWTGFTVQPGEMAAVFTKSKTTPKVHSLDIYTSGEFTALDRQHQVSIGFNGYQVKQDNPNYAWGGQAVPITGWNGKNIAKPDFQLAGTRNIIDEQQYGVFAVAKLQVLDPLKLIVGSRLTNWEQKTAWSQTKESNVLTPYAGLVFDLTNHLSLYTSYTSIFTPQSAKDVNGNILDPVEGNSIEAGIKANFYDGRLNLAAAYFDMKQDNFAVADGTKRTPDGEQAYIGVDGTTVKGYELSISGELLPNWNINAGYTHTDAKDRTGKPIGSSGVILPNDTFKLFTNYQWNKFTVGGGANFQSKFTGNLISQNAYWLVNLMGRYQIQDDVSISLNINNILDEKYLTADPDYYSFGAGRNITASLSYKF